MGITASASAPIIALAKEINDPSFSGTALSVANAGAFCGMSVMQPLLGYLLDLRWDGLVVEGTKIYPLAAYRGLFATCLAFLAVCLFSSLFIKETHCQNIYLQGNKSSSASSSQNILQNNFNIFFFPKGKVRSTEIVLAGKSVNVYSGQNFF